MRDGQLRSILTPFKRVVLSAGALMFVAACGGGGGSSPPPPPPPPPAVNQAPTADAGANQTVVEGNTITLSGAASRDADGSIASYAWAQTAGPNVSLSGADTATATFDPPLTDAQIMFTFELTVTDNDGESATATTDVTIEPSQPPTVLAGVDIEAVETETVTLNANVTDVDGTIASLAWVQTAGPTVTLSNELTVAPVFDAPTVAAVTDLEFELTATDSTNDAAADSVIVTINPNEPPVVSTRFPCDGCRFYDEPALSVAGSVTPGPDNTYVQGVDGIASVTVDAGAGAVTAIVQSDGEWIAQNVPVADDTSAPLSIAITAEDFFGETTDATLVLEYAPTLTRLFVAPDPVTADVLHIYDAGSTRPRLFTADLAQGTFDLVYQSPTEGQKLDQIGTTLVSPDGSQLLLNEVFGDIVSIDLTTGAVNDISGASRGTGPAFGQILDMALDADDNRLLTFDVNQAALLAVDIATGARTVISDNAGTGSGAAFIDPFYLTVDGAANTAILNEFGNSFISVDLATGNRSPVPFSGDNIALANSLEYDASRSRVAVLDFFSDNVVTLEVPGGNRSLLSAGTTDPAFATGNPREVDVDAVSDRYIVNDFSGAAINDTDRLLAIDPVTGDRSELFDNDFGSGPAIQGTAAVALDPADQVLYITSEVADNVLRLELATLERQLVADNSTGAGPSIGLFADVVVDTANNRLLVVDSSSASLVAVDIATGNRSVISSAVIGSGPDLVSPTEIEPDFANGRVYVLDQPAETIYTIDLTSGERTVFIDDPMLMSLMGLAGMELDVANNRMLLAITGDGSSIATTVESIDLTTTDRTVISSFTTGSGPTFNGDLEDISLLDDGENIMIAAGRIVYRVELATGNRTIVAADCCGNGEAVQNIRNMSYDATRNVLYAVSPDYDAVFMFDVVTGDRVVVGK